MFLFQYFLLLLLFSTSLVSTYDPSLFQLQHNIVSNHQFQNPFLPTQTSVYYSLGMPGWNCTVDCQHINIQKRCQNAPTPVSCQTSFQQAVDIDSDFVMDHYTQNIMISTEGQYFLRVKWMPSTYKPLGKNFGIGINGSQIANIVVTDGNYIDHIFETTFNASWGILNLDIFETNTINDTFGSYLGSVEMRYMAPINSFSSVLGPLSTISYPLLENVTASINKIPGNRIFF